MPEHIKEPKFHPRLHTPHQNITHLKLPAHLAQCLLAKKKGQWGKHKGMTKKLFGIYLFSKKVYACKHLENKRLLKLVEFNKNFTLLYYKASS